MTTILKTAATALVLNYSVHIGSTLAYAKLCVPQDIWDLAQSLATTSSPLCSTLLSVMQVTQNNYAVVLTTTVAAAITGLVKP
jgi:D-alanyl-D-alanine carboxypeptidase